MQNDWTPLVGLIWLAGAWLRLRRQARFYQIEEYMSRRYLRWLLAARSRWLPPRQVAIGLLGVALAASADHPYDSLAGGLFALLAVYPKPQGKIKKPLVMTARVKRILAVAHIVCALPIVGVWAAGAPSPAIGGVGLAVWLLAPGWLAMSNWLLTPLDAIAKRRFLRQAAVVLAQTQPKIIGITGSYGKTTTKSFLRDILSLRYQVYATPKSYNTLMGVSLAINRDLADDYRTEIFISEMGAYVPGEIARICQLTPPDIAIITEVGPQHLERFGSLETVQKAKYELVANLPPDGVAVFNWDNAYIRAMHERGYPATRLTVSRELSLAEARAQGVTWLAQDIRESLDGLSFCAIDVASGETAQIATRLHGDHNVTNLLLCIAVARREAIPLRDIARRVRSLQPAENRLVRETTAAGITIINDAYSANPKGVISALKLLGMHREGARLLITPGMVELGALQEGENRKLGMLAAEYATDIILVGESQTAPILRGIEATAFDRAHVHVVDSLEQSIAWYQRHLRAGDAVLFLNDLPDTY
ncbi:MAG: UDP-N-acetylmuramoyl-tripeptide--D-alanyl-D-alanine ligase [Chloroflexi bacterium]|nr:UDP-N-acetylmuramoyl-tripeptide--D-alanyl-D-alanine ligase [Chloroflexota bacterium]MCY4247725.1 UDP-N-acetylmuramoyl-tripeptide--D-alanyl-D-alanine ligase [Chloroflexota bacterium]